jgi:hypothetical protein
MLDRFDLHAADTEPEDDSPPPSYADLSPTQAAERLAQLTSLEEHGHDTRAYYIDPLPLHRRYLRSHYYDAKDRDTSPQRGQYVDQGYTHRVPAVPRTLEQLLRNSDIRQGFANLTDLRQIVMTRVIGWKAEVQNYYSNLYDRKYAWTGQPVAIDWQDFWGGLGPQTTPPHSWFTWLEDKGVRTLADVDALSLVAWIELVKGPKHPLHGYMWLSNSHPMWLALRSLRDGHEEFRLAGEHLEEKRYLEEQVRPRAGNLPARYSRHG